MKSRESAGVPARGLTDMGPPQRRPDLPGSYGASRRCAHDKLRSELDVLMLMVAAVAAARRPGLGLGEQQLARPPSQLVPRLPHGTQRYRGRRGELDVVVPDDRD